MTEVLLQRTRADAVAALYEAFFTRFVTPQELADATEEQIRKAIYSLGLAWRAKYLKELGQVLTAADGEVPKTRNDLEQLPGVGPYVAGAFLALHQNRHASFVDANVVRLLGRFFGFEWDGETRRRKWFLRLVEELFDHDYQPEEFGYALLDFTREICSRSPDCENCPLLEQCVYGQIASSSSPTSRTRAKHESR